MFFRILKKDLKRKKTMNVILLLFVILCSMFAAASVNNIIAVTGGIDRYFELANVPEVILNMSADCDMDERVRSLPSVREVKTENLISVMSSKSFKHNGKKLDNFLNTGYFISDKEMALNYFDEDNNVIKSVDKGCFYATNQFDQGADFKKGDVFVLEYGDTELELKYMGRLKGALFSTESTANAMIIINHEDHSLLLEKTVAGAEADYQRLFKNTHVYTDDPEEVRELVADSEECSFETAEDKKELYLYDMLAAYIMMVISVVLMITAFVVMRFTIGFTISEEFREIGVMKAVGINNGSIRSLYIVKYFAIAVIGSAAGFVCSLPLTDMMLETVSKNIVLDSENSKLTGMLSSVIVVAVILLFCYGCTRRVKKLSPIDAVRSGQTGERFGKKSLLHLGRSRLPVTGFLSLNDMLSAPKQFSIIAVVFTLCMLIMTMMSCFALTLKSEKLYRFFDIKKSEATIMEIDYFKELFTGNADTADELIEKTEKLLEENDMPGSCTMSLGTSCEVSYKENKRELMIHQTRGRYEDEMICDEGTPPRKDDEIILTGYAMKELGAEIGDRITLELDGREREFIITGRYSTFMGGGYSARVSDDLDLGGQNINSTVGLQIHFDGDPDKETVDKNIEKLKDVLETDKISSTSQLIKEFTGMSDTLSAIKLMMMAITVVVTAMIVVLMERSFISKEKSEIALMKAVGITNKSIIAQHTLRFVIISVIACAVSSAILMPVSNAVMNMVCAMMGDVSGIQCDTDPFEIYVICPMILIGVTVIGSWLTALYTNTISPSDTASIE